jgi:uncharacterized phosphosugar-binding protein
MTEFWQRASAVLAEVVDTQRGTIQAAAQLLATSISTDGVVHAFGTGHSRAVAHELAGRAGGLAAVNLLGVRDLVFFGKEDPAVILDPTCERDPDLAKRILDLADVRPPDCFVIVSSSGVNGSVVELARLVAERGHRIVAITSLQHSAAAPVRHPSGLRLHEIADVTIDNLSPVGDGLLQLPDGRSACAVSSISGTLIAQLLQAETIGRLERAGYPVELYRSQNLSDGDAINVGVTARTVGRVRPIEP